MPEEISDKTTARFTCSLQGLSKVLSTDIHNSELNNWTIKVKDLRESPCSWIKWIANPVKKPRLNITLDKAFGVEIHIPTQQMSSTNQVIVSEGLMIMAIKGIEAYKVNSTGLLEISINTTANHLFKNVGKELPKDVAKDNRLKENWITTIKYLRDDSLSLVATGAGQQSFQSWILTITRPQAACTFTGSYNISGFQIACIPGATCPPINNNQASIVLEIDSKNFCAQASAAIGLSSSLAVYSDPLYSLPGVNFLVDDLPLQSAFLEMFVSSTAVNIRSLVIKNIVVTVTNNQNYLYAFGTPTSTVSVYTNGVWIPGIHISTQQMCSTHQVIVSEGFLEISISTVVNHLLKIIGNELPKDVSKDNRLKENCITTIKYLREVSTPDSWIKWILPMKLADELKIGSEKGIFIFDIQLSFPVESSFLDFLFVQSLGDLVYYAFNLYGNEQIESGESMVNMDIDIKPDILVTTWIIDQVENWTISVGVKENTKILRDQEEMTSNYLLNNNLSQAHMESWSINAARRISAALANATSQIEVISGKRTTARSFTQSLQGSSIKGVSTYISALKNWATTTKDLRDTPGSWIKWNMTKLVEEPRLNIIFDKGFLVIQFLRDSVYYVVDLSNVPKCGSFNPYGNEQMEAENVAIKWEIVSQNKIKFVYNDQIYVLPPTAQLSTVLPDSLAIYDTTSGFDFGPTTNVEDAFVSTNELRTKKVTSSSDHGMCVRACTLGQWKQWVKTSYLYDDDDLDTVWKSLMLNPQFHDKFGDYDDNKFKECLQNVMNSSEGEVSSFCDAVLKGWNNQIQKSPNKSQEMKVEKGASRKKLKFEHSTSVVVSYATEGFTTNNFYSTRAVTVTTILDLTDKYYSCLVRGPSFTGKTGLRSLIAARLLDLNKNFVDISMLGYDPSSTTLDQFWKKWTNLTYGECFNSDTELYILIDEFQMIYPQSPDDIASAYQTTFEKLISPTEHTIFTQLFKKSQETHLVKVIAFSAYGSHKVGTLLATPFAFGVDGSYYNFTPDEFAELLNNFQSRTQVRFIRENGIPEFLPIFISDQTKLHVGYSSAILHAINDYFMKLNNIDDLFSYVHSSRFYLKLSNSRPMPSLSSLSEPEIESLKSLWYKKEEPLTSNQHYINFVKRGWVGLDAKTNLVSLYCPLYSQLLMIQLFSVARPKEDSFKNLEEFMMAFFHQIVAKSLESTLTKSKEGKILESYWQAEFYRIGSLLLRESSSFNVEVGPKVNILDGRLDFFINDDRRWAVEFLISGSDLQTGFKNRLEEHELRFKEKTGKYSPLEPLEFLVVDFRPQATPKTKKDISYSDLSSEHRFVWIVIYDNITFRSLNIFKFDKDSKMTEKTISLW